MPKPMTWSMAAAAPAAALARFPYDHATVEQTDTADPAAWRAANAVRFDRLYGTHGERAAPSKCPREHAARLAAARLWRRDTKPHFDAIYGP